MLCMSKYSIYLFHNECQSFFLICAIANDLDNCWTNVFRNVCFNWPVFFCELCVGKHVVCCLRLRNVFCDRPYVHSIVVFRLSALVLWICAHVVHRFVDAKIRVC